MDQKNALMFTAHESTEFPVDIAAGNINMQITLIVKSQN